MNTTVATTEQEAAKKLQKFNYHPSKFQPFWGKVEQIEDQVLRIHCKQPVWGFYDVFVSQASVPKASLGEALYLFPAGIFERQVLAISYHDANPLTSSAVIAEGVVIDHFDCHYGVYFPNTQEVGWCTTDKSYATGTRKIFKKVSLLNGLAFVLDL